MELFDCCLREQLGIIAEHFKLDVGDKRMKKGMMGIIKTNVMDSGVLFDKNTIGSPCGELRFTW